MELSGIDALGTRSLEDQSKDLLNRTRSNTSYRTKMIFILDVSERRWRRYDRTVISHQATSLEHQHSKVESSRNECILATKNLTMRGKGRKKQQRVSMKHQQNTVVKRPPSPTIPLIVNLIPHHHHSYPDAANTFPNLSYGFMILSKPGKNPVPDLFSH